MIVRSNHKASFTSNLNERTIGGTYDLSVANQRVQTINVGADEITAGKVMRDNDGRLDQLNAFSPHYSNAQNTTEHY